MDHEKFQQRLNSVLDDREQPEHDAQLRAMADGDRECAELLQAAVSLVEGVELLDHPTVASDMADRVLAAVRVERRPVRRLQIWVPLCVAAALLLAAIPLYRFWQSGGEETPPIAQPSVETTDPTTPQEAAELEYLVQTHRVGEVLGEAIWATSYDQLTPAQKQWVDRATQEISPVAHPMANTVAITVDAVVRTIEPNLPRP